MRNNILRKLIYISLLYFILPFIVYEIIFIVLLNPENLSFNKNITLAISLGITSFIIAITFPKGIYSAILIGIFNLLLIFIISINIFNQINDKITIYNMENYIIYLLIVFLASGFGYILHKNIINKIPNDSKYKRKLI